MVASGGAMILLALTGAYLYRRGKIAESSFYLRLLLWSLPLPYLANSCGWFVTEAGRQPWIVVGLQKVSDAASKTVTAPEIMTSLIGFTLIYGVLALAAVHLLRKFISKGPDENNGDSKPQKREAMLWN